MNTEMHPVVAEMLRMAQQVQSMGDAQADNLNAESFRGSDESGTVQVTVDGHQWLTSLHIEDGLLRLGIETVALRVNEAIQNAQATAAVVVEAENERLLESLGQLADSITAATSAIQAKPE
ncbi:YbaB/EbfC family nucleoid-associated protein [Mycobacterium lentiflavum]|uniref:YbaB/EbfC family nucleoid-associated protein n=1 Tax=Mycobacterium lentiflavum TaxID=141349 RepID=A0ABY3UMX3_MYCLN|nr:YbaB/EbfC family nucleoid-associated protein [Mycobacterium lentiflavum]ULP40944.1 YbaB/EbfC family nucleoid-associated protein [Mycobacterium lentiflavum]